jgi:hypothetical protein
MALCTHSVSISCCALHGCPMKVLPNLRLLFSDLFLSEKYEPSYYRSEQIAHTSTRRAKSPVPFVPIHYLASGSYAVCGNKLFVLCLDVHENHFTEDGNCNRHHHE